MVDIAVIQRTASPVEVTYLKEASADHNPILVHIATHQSITRDARKVNDWARYGPEFCPRLSAVDPLDTVRQIEEAVAPFDEVVVSAIDMFCRTVPGITPDYQHIQEKVSLLAREKDYFRKRWWRTRDPADKVAFNLLAGRLCSSMQGFRRSSWELAVARAGDIDPESHLLGRGRGDVFRSTPLLNALPPAFLKEAS